MMQRGVAFFLFTVCVLYLYKAHGFAMGTLINPKAGFMPIIVGWLGAVLSGLNVVRVFHDAGRREGAPIEIRRSALFAVGLVAYTALIGYLGFFVSTFAILFYLLKLTNPKEWKVALVAPIAVTTLLYVTFTHVLALPLP